ncbi:MAG TPA: glycosyltransferase family 1 protein [Candidatus Moranbacteria bacterium]|nr:glycosyltransferase family 1 protein [Candidatus Moranbacteria bacterium]
MEDKKIIVGINASFLRKQNTGIGQVTTNFLRKLINSKFQISNSRHNEMEFILYLEEDLPKGFKLPKYFTKKVFLPFWKRDDLIRKIWWEKCLLPKRAKKDNCDVFVSMYQCPTIFSKSVKHLMIVHDIIPKLFPEYLNNSRKKHYWKLTEKGIKKADRIVAVSRRTEKDLIQHLGISPMKITNSYIDIDGIYKEEVSEEKNKKLLKKYKLKPGYILAGGGYEVRKNVEGAIRAYKELDSRLPTGQAGLRGNDNHYKMPNLVIYGKLLPRLAPLATDAEKLVKELNLTKQVKLLDMVPQKDMPALFKNAIMFVYPSHYEGFGMPILEAMNTGTPVITSKVSSLPEVGGDSVLYCHHDDVEDIAMVMKNVMLNKDLRETLSARAKERAGQFDWNKFTEKVLNIIENL